VSSGSASRVDVERRDERASVHALPRPAARLLLKLPAREQLAGVRAEFRPALHALLLALRDDPFRAGTAVVGETAVRWVLDAGGYWIVYRTFFGDEPAIVVDAIRRRSGGPVPPGRSRVEVEAMPVLRRRRNDREAD
jgi:hypothetical protein